VILPGELHQLVVRPRQPLAEERRRQIFWRSTLPVVSSTWRTLERPTRPVLSKSAPSCSNNPWVKARASCG
jgi:hypothetical protein